MREIISILLSSAALSLPFILTGYIINFFLIKWGYIRFRKESPLFWITVYLIILVKQIWYAELPWQIFTIALLFGIALSGNRYELNQSFKKGRWWWKPKEKKGHRHSDSS